jgi:hypothetical protein
MNKKSIEMFRFVALRAPKMEDPKTIKEEFISFPEKSISEKDSIYLAYLKSTEGLEDVEKLITGQKILRGFKKSEAYFKDKGELEKSYPGFLAFYDWLISLESSNNMAYVQKNMGKLLKKELAVKLIKDNKKTAQLWDNFCVYVVEQSNPELIQLITNVLRVSNIVSLLDSKESFDMNRLERARVVLPQDIFPKPAFNGITAPVNDSTINPAILEKTNAISLYRSLKNELQKEKDYRLSELSQSSGNNHTISNYYILTDESKGMFSEDHQEALSVILGGRRNLNLDRIIELVDDRLNADYTALSRFVETSSKIGVFGNKLVDLSTKSLSPSNTKAAQKPVVWGADCDKAVTTSPFSVIYPCIFRKNPEVQLNFTIGDFKRVENELDCYSAGEIAHIENVLRGELKVRDTRRLNRTEETFSFEKESITEEERDVQSTDRYEMQRETQNVIDTETSFEAGVKVSASYGSILTVDANVGFATSTSTSNTTKNAVEYAQSVTEKARKKIYNRVLESRSTTKISEYEVKNNHTLQGADDEHTVGIYRWVDKTYNSKLMNYGKRLMIKFNIPEPGSFHLYNVKLGKVETSDKIIEKPIHPSSDEAVVRFEDATTGISPIQPLDSFIGIDENNYHLWASAYGADVPVPPMAKQVIGKSYHVGPADPSELSRVYSANSGEKQDILIPEGYTAEEVYMKHNLNPFDSDHSGINNDDRRLIVNVGDMSVYDLLEVNGTFDHYVGTQPYTGVLPVSWEANKVDMVEFNLTVGCYLTPEKKNDWKKQVYKAIMDAYENKVAEFNQHLEESKIQAGVQINGTNPRRNLQIIEQELKRNCIDFIRVYNQPLMSHHVSEIHGTLPAMGTSSQYSKDMPIVQNPMEAMINGRYADFMESAFEWKEMVYDLLPYYWGHPDRWTELYQLEDTDPLFTNFLQSGSATVTVPVKPGMEKHLMYYIHTGKMWMGGDVPAIDTALNNYLDAELADYDPLADPVEEARWKDTVPTSLTVLQQDANGVDDDVFCA